MKVVVKQSSHRLLLDLLCGRARVPSHRVSVMSLNSASSVSIISSKLAELSHYLRETARSFCFITVKSPEPGMMVSVKLSPQIIAELAVLGSENCQIIVKS